MSTERQSGRRCRGARKGEASASASRWLQKLLGISATSIISFLIAYFVTSTWDTIVKLTKMAGLDLQAYTATTLSFLPLHLLPLQKPSWWEIRIGTQTVGFTAGHFVVGSITFIIAFVLLTMARRPKIPKNASH